MNYSTWVNIDMQILPMEKIHSLQLTLGHAQVNTMRHRNITQVTENISQVKHLSQVKNIKEQIQVNTKQYPHIRSRKPNPRCTSKHTIDMPKYKKLK